MKKFERLDFEGPKKEFIKNNLMFVLGYVPQEQENNIAQITYEQNIKYSHNRYLRALYRIVYRNDPIKIERFNKQMISILDKMPKLKKWLKARLIGEPHQNEKVSLEHLLALSVNDFITQLYITMLGREPDNEGFNSWQKAICSSMPKEAAIFAMSRTNEFGDRFQIENIDRYRVIYRKYKVKRILKRAPLIGYIISVILLPKRIEQLISSQNISYENMFSMDCQFYNTKLHRINEIQAFNHQFLCEFISKTDKNEKNINSSILALQDEIANIDSKLEKQLVDLRSGIHEKDKNVNSIILNLHNEILSINNNFEKQLVELRLGIDADIKKIGDGNESVLAKYDYLLRDKEKSLYLQMYDPHYEMETLQKSNIALFENFIINSSEENFDKTVVVGHYAREIFEDVSNKVSQISYLKPATLESMLCNKSEDMENGLVIPTCLHQIIEKQDKLIVLNSAVATMLVMENKLQELAPKIKNELILVFDSNGNNGLSVVWGEGFSGVEKSSNDEFYRWYQGTLPNGVIHVYNNTKHYQTCTVSFSVTVLDTRAQLTIYAEDERFNYNMEYGYVQVSLDMKLAPGVNAIIIEYYGKAVQPIDDLRFLKFAVKGFSVVCGIYDGAQLSVNGVDAYRKKTSCNVALPTPSDEVVRNNLHLNGFFEVERFLSSNKLDTLVSSGLSRYCEANVAYRFIKQYQICQDSGLNIYVARRKGEYIYDL